MYRLEWQDEIIEDDIATLEDARYLQSEYRLAFHDNNIEIIEEKE